MHKPTATLWQSSLPTLFKMTILGSALATLGLTGCASTQSNSKKNTTAYLDASSLDGLEDLLSATDMRAVEGDRLLVLKHGDVWKRMTVGFKMNLNYQHPRINAQRSWFISRQPYLDRLSARASRYLYHTVKEAERRGLPTELALLPVIESSYDPAATSSAAAAGLWQFIPSTGRIYGLQQNAGYDGRRDVVESTRAAYEFLGSLYNQFGSWELALAAYNAGPGRVQQAINRNKAAGLPTDYWSLRLPEETMNYVPRFLAVAQMIKHPQQYGVSLPPIANRPHFREVAVGPVGLNDIAKITGLSRAELYQLNPGHRGERIDVSSPQRILIPADLSPTVDARLLQLKNGTSAALLASQTVKPSVSPQVITPSKATPPTLNSTLNTAKKTTPPPLASTAKAPVVTPAPVLATTKTPVVNTAQKTRTPVGSSALAAFAAQSDLPIPSAPRVPVAVTPAQPVQKPVLVEPPISAVEREKLQAAIQLEDQKTTVDDVLKPVVTPAEQAEVVAELTALAPVGTEIVNPSDGKIQLTAIQTSLSVAEQQGKELTKGFSYPKTVAEQTQPDSIEAQLNQGKNYVNTGSEVVVVAPQGKRTTYTVQSGDTLLLIAAKNGVNWRDVANWNQIDPNATLYAGATIYLYDAKPVVEEAKVKAQPEVYIVQANDSLSGVASQFGLSLKQLADYNTMSTTSGLFVGQKLALKDSPTARQKREMAAKEVKTTATKIATQSYTVKSGEYLKLIADRYALSNAELAALTEGLNANSSLRVGQKINVPQQTTESTKVTSNKVIEQKIENVKVDRTATQDYQVKRGETLYSIANQSKMTVTELAQLNGLTASRGLQAGQTIKIPAGSQVPETYRVQSGDTLSAIAAKYDLTIDHLLNLNGLSRHTALRVGQQLQLTGERVETTTTAPRSETVNKDIHVVKSGETLSSIARQYYLQLSYLADLNGLKQNSPLRVGQQLKVNLPPEIAAKANNIKPASKATSVSYAATEAYTVKAGESLNAIAARMGMSAANLAEMNNLSARAGLRVGQSIQIPKLVTEYKIRRGDTLIGLASRHGVDTDALAKLNNMQPNAQLRVGEVIKVPN